MEETRSLTGPTTDPTAKAFSRRTMLKGSMTLTVGAIAVPAALTIGTIEAAPVAERAAVAVEQWFEEVGGI